MHTQHLDIEGKELPSVSAIPAIFAKDMSGFNHWICSKLHAKDDKCCVKAADDYYQESADLGNDVHSLMEAFLNGESFADGVPEYQAKVFAPVAEFFKDSGYVPLSNELKMTGEEFGGTLDTLGTFTIPFWEKQRKTFWEGGEFADKPTTEDVWIVDLKIKSKLDITHPLQLYGYSKLVKEKHAINAKYGLIVRREKRLDKTPEIQLRGYYLADYAEIWEAAFKCWKFLNA